MLTITSPRPTTAERIRTVCARAGTGLLAVEPERHPKRHPEQAPERPIATPLHHLMRDGSFVLAVPGERAAAARYGSGGGSQALLELTDYAPLPLREPVRSLVWIRGRLRQVPWGSVTSVLDEIATENPDPTLLQVHTPRSGSALKQENRYALLRLETESVVVTDPTGAAPVGVAELLAARPDPFCEIESTLLWHLTTAHGDVVARLVSRLPSQLRRGPIRPLGLDRYGVQFRVEGDDGDRDIRLPFHRPVDDMNGLGQAIRVLMGCPFVNGLHARRRRAS